MKALQTRYNGYYFRSRTEARWAMFFDTCGIKFDYEPEGYKLRNGSFYLPDFFIPEKQKFPSGFYEVKPNTVPEKEWLDNLEFLFEDSLENVFLLTGQPDFVNYLTYRNFSDGFANHQWYRIAFNYRNGSSIGEDYEITPFTKMPEKLHPGYFSNKYRQAVHRSRSARF